MACTACYSPALSFDDSLDPLKALQQQQQQQQLAQHDDCKVSSSCSFTASLSSAGRGEEEEEDDEEIESLPSVLTPLASKTKTRKTVSFNESLNRTHVIPVLLLIDDEVQSNVQWYNPKDFAIFTYHTMNTVRRIGQYSVFCRMWNDIMAHCQDVHPHAQNNDGNGNNHNSNNPQEDDISNIDLEEEEAYMLSKLAEYYTKFLDTYGCEAYFFSSVPPLQTQLSSWHSKQQQANAILYTIRRLKQVAAVNNDCNNNHHDDDDDAGVLAVAIRLASCKLSQPAQNLARMIAVALARSVQQEREEEQEIGKQQQL